jgi:hypothetical protein
MDINHHWLMINQLLDRHGRAITVILDNLPSQEAQYIIDAIESPRYVQESYPLLGILVPEVDHDSTSLVLNDIEEEIPNLSMQRSYTNSSDFDRLVPNMIYDETSLALNSFVLDGPIPSVQGSYSDPDILDTSVPDMDHNVELLPSNDSSFQLPA